MTADPLSRVFSALADPTRRDMVARLASGDASVGELARPYDMSVQAVSKHLRVLRDARLVREDRDGRQRVYRLTPGPLRDVSQWIESYRSFWPANLMSLKRHLEGGKEFHR